MHTRNQTFTTCVRYRSCHVHHTYTFLTRQQCAMFITRTRFKLVSCVNTVTRICYRVNADAVKRDPATTIHLPGRAHKSFLRGLGGTVNVSYSIMVKDKRVMV